MKVFSLRFLSPLPDEEFEILKTRFSKDRYGKARLYPSRFSEEAATLGQSLLSYRLTEDYGLDASSVFYEKNEYGKPLIRGEGVHFNLSHSGKWIACVIDSSPCGIDIERIRDIDLEIARRFFSKDEYSGMEKKEITQRNGFFFELWTLKESFIKAIGKGLFHSLASFSVLTEGGSPKSELSFGGGNWFLKQYAIDAEYRLAVCASHRGFPEKVSEVKIDTIIASLGR